MWWELFVQDVEGETLIRIGISLVAGFVIGSEREIHGRAAGLRTTMLVCLASCVAMLVSEGFYEETFSRPSAWHPDPMRLAAGLLTGIGFLGAGVILHQRANVIRGVTTAATIWLAAIIGIAAGGGALGVALIATGLAAVILAVIPRLEDHLENVWYSDLRVRLDMESASAEKVEETIRSHGITINGIDWKEDFAARRRTIVYHLKYRKGNRLDLPTRIVDALGKLPGTLSVHWHG